MTAKTYKEKLKEIEEKINGYFEYCDRENAAAGDSKKIPKPYTVSGLLYFLDLTRKEYERLLEKKSYAKLFARALARIEVFLEENALAGNIQASAASNTLKYSLGWNDSRPQDKEGNASGVIKIVLDGELMKLAE